MSDPSARRRYEYDFYPSIDIVNINTWVNKVAADGWRVHTMARVNNPLVYAFSILFEREVR